jgi:hypothetical protein
MGIDKLRDLVAQLQMNGDAAAKAGEKPDALRIIAPLLVEVAHELANLETMVGALERRLDRLEARK